MRAYRPSRFSAREDVALDPVAQLEKEAKLRLYAERVALGAPLFETARNHGTSARMFPGQSLSA